MAGPPGLDPMLRLAQQNTWAFIVVLYFGISLGGYVLKSKIEDNGTEIESLSEDHGDLRERVHRIDAKQDHLAERQERVMDAVDANSDDIQDLEITQKARNHNDSDVDPGSGVAGDG